MRKKTWYAALLECEDPQEFNDLLVGAVKHLAHDVLEREGQEASIQFVMKLAAMSLSNLVGSGGLGNADSQFQLLTLGLAESRDFREAEPADALDADDHLAARKVGEVLH